MARSLPLGNPADAIPESSAAAVVGPNTLSGAVAVYDPAMCCPTGVCGPGVDPALLQAARDLRWLQGKGAVVQRFNLAQEPQAFVDQPRIAGLLQAFGERALPATIVNGEILVHGRYPTRDELIAALGGATAAAPNGAPRGLPVSVSSCEPGSGCC